MCLNELNQKLDESSHGLLLFVGQVFRPKVTKVRSQSRDGPDMFWLKAIKVLNRRMGYVLAKSHIGARTHIGAKHKMFRLKVILVLFPWNQHLNYFLPEHLPTGCRLQSMPGFLPCLVLVVVSLTFYRKQSYYAPLNTAQTLCKTPLFVVCSASQITKAPSFQLCSKMEN